MDLGDGTETEPANKRLHLPTDQRELIVIQVIGTAL